MPVGQHFIDALAEKVTARAVRRAIVHLQRMDAELSGDDSGLINVWDEICVQVQNQESTVWDAYQDTVQSIVSGVVKGLAPLECEAVWLQTDRGSEWWF